MAISDKIRLGVNVDHVATLRNARGEAYPDPVEAAKAALAAGADGITAHLREDRRHVRDRDVVRLATLDATLNLEMAATEEMLSIAKSVKPHAVCLVPERRAELTTEGGLNAAARDDGLRRIVGELGDAGIRVSLFINPDRARIDAAYDLGAPVVEFHTGEYARKPTEANLKRLADAARHADSKGVEPHAGHGLTFDNVAPVAAIPEIRELNIGHFLIARAVLSGLGEAVAEMKRLMIEARAR